MVFLLVRFVFVDDWRQAFVGLVVRVGVLMRLSEELAARVIGREKYRGSVVRGRGGRWWVEDDVVITIRGRY